MVGSLALAAVLLGMSVGRERPYDVTVRVLRLKLGLGPARGAAPDPLASLSLRVEELASLTRGEWFGPGVFSWLGAWVIVAPLVMWWAAGRPSPARLRQAPPAGPQWVSRLAPLEPQALGYDKPLCASLDGFTLHAATRAGVLDSAGREALLRYVLRPPVAQERVEQRPDGLVRITLKKAYNDRAIAVDMDPLSLLLPAGLKRASTAVPHREVRGGAGPGEPVEVASRATIARSHRRGRQAGSRGRLPPVG
jgi:hypothetical protein